MSSKAAARDPDSGDADEFGNKRRHADVSSSSNSARTKALPSPKDVTPHEKGTSDRKKQLDAEQGARSAIVEGNGMTAKLEDEQTVTIVTPQQLAACKKKVSAALAPEKIRFLTNGSDARVCATQGVADSDVEKLLQDLNVINAKLDGVRSLIQTLHCKSDGSNPGLLDDSIALARAAGIRVPTCLEALVLTRAMKKAEGNQDCDVTCPRFPSPFFACPAGRPTRICGR